MSRKSSAQPNFDRVATLYRWAEYAALGPLLQRMRTHWLPLRPECKQALVLGDGDGRFLEQLLLTNHHGNVLAVDSSAAMLERLQRRCSANPSTHAARRLHTLHADALAISPEPATDLVVTHFFLDCLTQQQVQQLVRNITPQLAPGALWLVSDFALPQQPLLRPFAWAYIRVLYAAFRLLTGLQVHTLPNPQQALQEAGFSLQRRSQRLGGLLYTEIWRLE